MKTPNMMSVCVVILFGAAKASAGQPDKSPEILNDSNSPKSIACAQETGEPLGQCAYSIKRNEKGKITITAIFANGFKRRLFFVDGKFLKASVTMSGTGTDTDWSLDDGIHMIRVDDQRFVIPDTLLAFD